MCTPVSFAQMRCELLRLDSERHLRAATSSMDNDLPNFVSPRCDCFLSKPETAEANQSWCSHLLRGGETPPWRRAFSHDRFRYGSSSYWRWRYTAHCWRC